MDGLVVQDTVSKGVEDRFIEFYNIYYSQEISSMLLAYPQKRSVYVDIKNLEKFDSELANELINNPDAVLPSANSALLKLAPAPETLEKGVHARFYGLGGPTMPLIQDVGSDHIGKLLTLDSLIVKKSEIIPMVQVGVYKCALCGNVTKIEVERDNVPDVCPQCKRRALRQVNEESKFVNLQRIAVQDPLEKLRGTMPTWQLEVWLEDDMVNRQQPGDRIGVTGVLRIRPRRNAHGKQEKSQFAMFVDAISIMATQKEFSELEISQEEEKEIKELAKDPHIFEKISKSIAPSIYGYEEIKKAMALQLFGGTPNKKLIDQSLVRSDIHILLIGDPGSAKTRLLQSTTALVPKGIYVSGKSTTSAGLTAAAERDEFSEGGWTLRAGALVLGSGGEVSIDEFDKISDDDKSALLEAMESQTISIAKAGIVARFNAKTSILAAANPKYGRFDPNVLPAEQFDIPPTLLSRFDLIFPIRDIIDETLDRNIAHHILVQHSAAGAQIAEVEGYEQVEAPPIAAEMLRKYVAYAKRSVNPRLSPEAMDRIQKFYLELRKLGMRSGTTPMTPRQIEGLVRLAEASAKSRLAETVELRDTEMAIGLVNYMLQTLAVEKGGAVNIDILTTGFSRDKVDKLNLILGIIKKLEADEKEARYERVLEEAEKAGVDKNTSKRYIDDLSRTGDIYTPKPGFLKIVRREAE
ncbi:MAG: minichromosome maintenance protein MCM [Candidatus Micrarchaeota archaeon]|nr:minichromosome maintenance protein MCM [Candidatus Micrarchaeota archaeon]